MHIKKVSLFRLAAHDFNRALRVWRSYMSPIEIFESLVDQRSKALASLAKTSAFSVFGALWLSANNTTLSLKLPLLELSIPAFYVNFAVAIALLAVIIGIINYFTLNEFVRIATNKLFKFDDAAAFAVLKDGSAAWSIGLVVQFRFFLSGKTHHIWGAMGALLPSVPLLSVVIFVYCVVFSTGLDTIYRDGLTSFSGIVSLLSCLINLYPIMIAVVILTPFKLEKNITFIRRIFLSRIYRRSGQRPPRWLSWV